MIIWMITALMVGMMAVEGVITYMFAKKLDDNVHTLTYQTIQLGTGIVSSRLKAVEDFVFGNLVTNENYISLRSKRENRGILNATIAKELSSYYPYYTDMDGFFFYDASADLLVFKIWSGERKDVILGNAHRSAELRNTLTQMCLQNETGEWIVKDVDGVSICLYARAYEDQYFGVIVRTDELLEMIVDESTYSEITFITNSKGEEITGTHSRTVDLLADSAVFNGEHYMQILVGMDNMSIFLCTWIPYAEINGLLRNSAVYWAILILGAGFTIGVVIYIFHHSLMQPLALLNKGMEEFSEGRLDTKILSQSNCREINAITKSFNLMTDQIKELKIATYEKELAGKDVKLKYLQIQMKPHFFLNILNVIYMLSMKGDITHIRTLTLELVRYTRYVLSDKASLVSLRDEMDFVNHYVNMMQIRYPYQSSVTVEGFEERISSFPIPPLCIQTFVENAFKYAVSDEHEIKIWIRFHLDEEKLQVVIDDAGKGFPEEMITKRNQTSGNFEYPEGHIGIRNVCERMQLLYKGNAAWEIGNRPEGGGHVKLCLPMEGK